MAIETTRIKVRNLSIFLKNKVIVNLACLMKIEVVYVAMKDDSNEDTTALISYVNKDDKWIIDSGCSHHMTGDKNKFKTFENCDENSVKFVTMSYER